MTTHHTDFAADFPGESLENIYAAFDDARDDFRNDEFFADPYEDRDEDDLDATGRDTDDAGSFDASITAMPHIPDAAPCRAADADLNDWFDPLDNRPTPSLHYLTADDVAADLCDGCPALDACLRWALINPDLDGILGGTTAEARAELRQPHSAA